MFSIGFMLGLLIVAAFSVFGITLAGVSFYAGGAPESRASASVRASDARRSLSS